MKRLELIEMIEGEGACTTVSGIIWGVGVGSIYSLTPIGVGFGVALVGLGSLGGYICSL